MSLLSNIREPNPLRTSSGEEHGLVKVTGNSVQDSDFKRFKEKDRSTMESLRKDESKLIKVRYINTKGANERLSLTYCRWDGDPLLSYNFIPNSEYEIPKGLIKQINEKKNHRRSGLLDSKGSPLAADQMESSEHMFVAVNF